MLNPKQALPNRRKAEKLREVLRKQKHKEEKTKDEERWTLLEKEIDARLLAADNDVDDAGQVSNYLDIKLNASYYDLTTLMQRYAKAGWNVCLAFDQTTTLTGYGFPLFKWFPEYETNNTYYLHFYLR